MIIFLVLDHKVTMSDGSLLSLGASTSAPPMAGAVQISPELMDKTKLAMSQGYNTENKALTLTKFYANEQFHVRNSKKIFFYLNTVEIA